MVDRLNRPSMGLNDRTTNGESEAQAVAFGGDEGLEQAIDAVWSDSGARVAYQDLNVIRVATCGQRDRPPDRRDPGHGIAGIQEQVHENLLQLDAIAKNRRLIAVDQRDR